MNKRKPRQEILLAGPDYRVCKTYLLGNRNARNRIGRSIIGVAILGEIAHTEGDTGAG